MNPLHLVEMAGLVLQPILFGLLGLLLELQVESIHHFLLEVLRLFLVFAVWLHSYIEMVAGIEVIDPWRSIGLYLLDVLLVEQLALHEPFELLHLLSLLHRVCFLVQLLAIKFIIFSLLEFCVGAAVELVVQFASKWRKLYLKDYFFILSISLSLARILSNSSALYLLMMAHYSRWGGLSMVR